MSCEKEIVGGSYDYTLHVKTGDQCKAGTNANVYCILIEDEHKSEKKQLNGCGWWWFKHHLQSGQLDQFIFKEQHYEAVESIELWREHSIVQDDWYIDTIKVKNETTKTETVFPVFRWIRANEHYRFIPLDTLLPQHDNNRKDQRQRELEYKRAKYHVDHIFLGQRPMAGCHPMDEEFSFAYDWNIKILFIKLYVKSFIDKWWPGNWCSINDMKKVYGKWFFPEPKDMGRWDDDVAFGRQRIAGINNCFITLLEKKPKKRSFWTTKC